MPSKTAARSGARSSRSKAGSRSGSRSSRPAPRRKPAKRRQPRRRIPATGLAIGRGARAGWLMVARGAGSTARSVGRARDIDPGHRRDGIALALLGIAVIVVASSWFDAARPVGGWIDDFLRMLIGSAVAAVAARADRDRGRADADRARSRRPAAADSRRSDDRAARARPVASVVRFAGHPGRSPARRRVHRLRHRWPAVGGADRVDRRPAAVHRRAVRPAAGDRHDDPRGARHRAGDVRHPDAARGRPVLRRRAAGVRRRGGRGLLRRLLRRSVGLQRRRGTGVACRSRRAGDIRWSDAARQLPARRRGADRPRADPRGAAQEGQAGQAGLRPCRGGPVHAAVAGSAEEGRPAEAAQCIQ